MTVQTTISVTFLFTQSCITVQSTFTLIACLRAAFSPTLQATFTTVAGLLTAFSVAFQIAFTCTRVAILFAGFNGAFQSTRLRIYVAFMATMFTVTYQATCITTLFNAAVRDLAVECFVEIVTAV